MARKLTHKQYDKLASFSHEQLLNQFYNLLEKYPDIQKIIVSEWLKEPSERVKEIAKQYQKLSKKISKSDRYFDYYTANEIVITYLDTLTMPLKALVPDCPQMVADLAHKMIVDFDNFWLNVDTSDGGWQMCHEDLYKIYLSALSKLPSMETESIIIQLFDLLQNDPSFNYDYLKLKEINLSKTIKIALLDKLIQEKSIYNAFKLSVLIGDIKIAKKLYDNHNDMYISDILSFAQLLIDELETESAITLLLSIQHKKERERFQWVRLISIAYRDNGQTDKAKTIIIDDFKKLPIINYWQLYMQITHSQEDLPIFIEIAKSKGIHYAVEFLAELDDYVTINTLLNEHHDKIAEVVNELNMSFCRKLSTTLSQHGYYDVACELRQQLAGITLSKGQNRYYKYAVSDIKKLLDYTLEMKDQTRLEKTLDWIQKMYQQHYRKISLWNEIHDNIPQLAITNTGEVIIYCKQ